MGRICTICSNSQVAAINQGLAANQSLRFLAARFAVGRMSLSRHYTFCVSRQLQEAERLGFSLCPNCRQLHQGGANAA